MGAGGKGGADAAGKDACRGLAEEAQPHAAITNGKKLRALRQDTSPIAYAAYTRGVHLPANGVRRNIEIKGA
jgi:hypothetical protein